MDKIDRVIKIISESSAAQERAKERSKQALKIQKQKLLVKNQKLEVKTQEKQNQIKDREGNSVIRKGIADKIRGSKFSKPNITKVSDEGKTGVSAVGQTVGNVAKVGAAAAKNVAKGALKTAVGVGSIRKKQADRKDESDIRGLQLKKEKIKLKLQKNKLARKENKFEKKFPVKKNLSAKSMREEFIQEVENKKDKVDKVIDIMRGKNKIQINPEVKESVDKKKI